MKIKNIANGKILLIIPFVLSGLIFTNTQQNAYADWIPVYPLDYSGVSVSATGGSSTVETPDTPSVTASSTFSDADNEATEGASVDGSVTVSYYWGSGIQYPLTIDQTGSINGSAGPSDQAATALSSVLDITDNTSNVKSSPLEYSDNKVYNPRSYTDYVGVNIPVSITAVTSAAEPPDNSGNPSEETEEQNHNETSTASAHAQDNIQQAPLNGMCQ